MILFFHLHIYFSLDTDEELNEWKSKFDERIAVLETKVNKLSREKMDNKETSRHLEDDIAKNIKEIAKLQALIEVVFLYLFLQCDIHCASLNFHYVIIYSLYFVVRLKCPRRIKETPPFEA